MNIDLLIARLKEFDALRDNDKTKRGSQDRIEPEYAEAWPDRTHPSIVSALQTLGRPRPYRHQADAIEQSLDGADVVMESPTASGKTLAFAVPMLDTLIRDRDSHALLLYPTKALALDSAGLSTRSVRRSTVCGRSSRGHTTAMCQKKSEALSARHRQPC